MPALRRSSNRDNEAIPSSPPPPYQTLPPTPVPSPARERPTPPRRQPTGVNTVPVASAAIHPQQNPTVFYYPPAPAAAPAAAPRPYPSVLHYPARNQIRPPCQGLPGPVHDARPNPQATIPFNPTPNVRRAKPRRLWQAYMNMASLTATLNDAGNLAVETYEAVVSPQPSQQQYMGAVNAVGVRLDELITSIDSGTYNGDANQLVVNYVEPPSVSAQPSKPAPEVLVLYKPPKGKGRKHQTQSTPNKPRPQAPVTSVSPFAKAYQYANAYTPSILPPLKLYFATWPLLCLAATYSRRVYDKPAGRERHTYISGDWFRGTKAMVIKSVPLDDMNTIVFAIRGTQNFSDWAVNVRTEPKPPSKFLDDEGNLCHAGFLHVARKMVNPVAARLRELLNENPRRSTCSLLITGHSAGGAVAALLYSHMLSQSVSSDLTLVRGLFKRVHCITFGAPPVSLLPLKKPDHDPSQIGKSLFFSFVNEGDPVTRADKAYVKSLLELYARPSPLCSNNNHNSNGKKSKPTWKVPEATLSIAGRPIVLRLTRSPHSSSTARNALSKKKKKPEKPAVRLEAVVASDADLRGLIFGDPLVHTMDLYARRIEQLATEVVVGRVKVK